MGCGDGGGRYYLRLSRRRRSFAPPAVHVEFAAMQLRLPVARHRMARVCVGPMLRCCCFLLVATSAITLGAGPDYPPTAKRPVTETYHGVTVVDDFRWLEDDASPEVKRWVADGGLRNKLRLPSRKSRRSFLIPQSAVPPQSAVRSASAVRGPQCFRSPRSAVS